MKEACIETYLKYDDVLQAIRNTENHLLVGNGFNRSLAVDTSYKNIFLKMMESDYSVYTDVQEMVERCHYDLEVFIGELCNSIPQSDIFLPKYIGNKIKLDFMRAAQEIVKSEVRKVYSKEKEGVFLLLKNFTNYFTLNYDSLLYLLLMKYKPENDRVIAFQPTLEFLKGELNAQHDNIYNEIKTARDKGILNLKLGINEDILNEPLRMVTKTHFIMEIQKYVKRYNKGWTYKDIERTVALILEEEKNEDRIDSADDGFRLHSLFEDNEYEYDTTALTQNLFFLHGAFHIYKDGKVIKKITKDTNKALYDRLEEVLNDNNKELICIFKSDNKQDDINKSEYLQRGLDKLLALSGNMVIIGCAFSDNDRHVFNQINQSAIDTLYISGMGKDIEHICANAKGYFPDKKIVMFDAGTISYAVPEKSTEEEKIIVSGIGEVRENV